MLSVIIPTRNRSDLLALALESISKQTLDANRFEVLVIDNGSTDLTSETVLEWKKSIKNLHYHFDSEPGLHVGRHIGMKKAAYDILVYADDDIRALPTWLEALAEVFTDKSIALVGGNNYPDFKAEPPAWLMDMWNRPSNGGHSIPSLSIISLGTGRHELSPRLVWGCNFSIRKSVLLEAGGFHPDAFPQEKIIFRGDGETHVSNFIIEKSYKCMFDSNASVYHAVTADRMTHEYFIRRAYNQGISDSYSQLREQVTSQKSAKSIVSVVKSKLYLMKRILNSETEVSRLEKKMKAGYREGFEFHQKSYKNSEEIRNWVHKERYF
jgi:glycosyltransferase involved in cell wall biosynthesis